MCDLADGQKGAQVSTIHSVEAGSAPAQRSNLPAIGSRYPRQSVSGYDDYGYGSKPSSGGTVEGTVSGSTPTRALASSPPIRAARTFSSTYGRSSGPD